MTLGISHDTPLRHRNPQVQAGDLGEHTRSRLEAASICFTANEPKLQALIGDESFKKLVLDAMVRSLPLSLDEKELLDQLLSDYRRDGEQVNYRTVLASMLYLHPFELPVLPDLERIPDWLRTTYLIYVVSAPQYFRHEDELNGHINFFKLWADKIYKKIEQAQPSIQYADNSNTTDALSVVWNEAGTVFAHSANFVPLYFKRGELREIFRQRGLIIDKVIKKYYPQLSFGELPPRQPRDKIRLGVLAAHFGPKTETYASIPVFEHLDPDRFEVSLFAIRATDCPVEQYCKSKARRFVVLPEDFEDQAFLLREYDLDIIFYCNNLTAYTTRETWLASLRLARVQVTSICSPVTTGLGNMDYFLTGTLTEPLAKANDEYTERLVRMEGSGICFNYSQRPPASEVCLSRDALNIPHDALVFISGANFNKLVPDVRDAWVRILKAVPGSVLVLYPFGPCWGSAYDVQGFLASTRESFEEHGVTIQRLVLMQTLPSPLDVLKTLALADIYMDSFPYSGATSLLDPLEVGLPIVVMEGEVLRFSQGSALLREAGLGDLVTNGTEAYIDRAIALAGDLTLRNQLRMRIKQAMLEKPPFLNPLAFAPKIAAVLEQIAQ